MSAEQIITPEESANIRKWVEDTGPAWPYYSPALNLLNTIDSLRAEAQRLTELGKKCYSDVAADRVLALTGQDIHAVAAMNEEAWQVHIANVQRLRDEARRSDAGRVEVPELVLDALKDARSGWRCIREDHGDLYGIGWDRVEQKLTEAISRLSPSPQPESEKPAPWGNFAWKQGPDGEEITVATKSGVYKMTTTDDAILWQKKGEPSPQPATGAVAASDSWAARFLSLTTEERLFVLRCGVNGSGKYAASPSTGSDGRGLWDAPERLGLLVCVGSFAWHAPGFLEGIASLAGSPQPTTNDETRG